MTSLKKPQTGHMSSSSTRGFTLVELLVSVGLFTVVATIVSGTVVTILDANARAQRISTAINNVSFAVDSMTRDIRTGYGYHCGSANSSDDQSVPVHANNSSSDDCSGGDTLFSYSDGRTQERIGFRLHPVDKILETRTPSDSTWQPITAPDISIETLEFVVSGSEDGDGGDEEQPRVQIRIEGYVEPASAGSPNSDFKLQTHVTQRGLDI